MTPRLPAVSSTDTFFVSIMDQQHVRKSSFAYFIEIQIFIHVLGKITHSLWVYHSFYQKKFLKKILLTSGSLKHIRSLIVPFGVLSNIENCVAPKATKWLIDRSNCTKLLNSTAHNRLLRFCFIEELCGWFEICN